MWKNPFWKISFLQGFITRRGFNFPAEIKHITNFKPLLFCCVPCKFPFHGDLRDLKFLWDSSSEGSQVLPWETTFWLRACSRRKWEFCEIKKKEEKKSTLKSPCLRSPWKKWIFFLEEQKRFTKIVFFRSEKALFYQKLWEFPSQWRIRHCDSLVVNTRENLRFFGKCRKIWELWIRVLAERFESYGFGFWSKDLRVMDSGFGQNF